MPRKAAPHPPAPPTPSIPPEPIDATSTLKIEIPQSLHARLQLIQRCIISRGVVEGRDISLRLALQHFLETAVLAAEREPDGIANATPDHDKAKYIHVRMRGRYNRVGTVRVPRAPVCALNGIVDDGSESQRLAILARVWPRTPDAPEDWAIHSCEECGIQHGKCPECDVKHATHHEPHCPWSGIPL